MAKHSILYDIHYTNTDKRPGLKNVKGRRGIKSVWQRKIKAVIRE